MARYGKLYGANGIVPSAVFAGSSAAKAVYYGELQIWPDRPTHAPEWTKFEAAGPHTYTIPTWADKIDVGVIGGGSSGSAGSLITGSGGRPGAWVCKTFDIASFGGVAKLNAVVGAGGAPSSHPGGETSITIPVFGVLRSPGGSGINSGVVEGASVVTKIFNGQSYVGGASAPAVQVNPIPAKAPGGAGSGGGLFGPGTAGAAGGVWIYAYQE